MHEVALQTALRRMDIASISRIYDFRQMARTILSKVLKASPDCITLQMGHPVGITTERIYNPTLRDPEHRLAKRKAMMQAWADWLDGLREGEDMVVMAA